MIYLPSTIGTLKLIFKLLQKEQLERARLEQINAAAKMKKETTAAETCEKSEDEDPAGGKAEEETVEKGGSGPVEPAGGPPTVWLCLRCGSQACGANGKGHCLAHYKAPR